MMGHKLLHILETFTRKEMTRFKEMAHSPYFNKHKKVRLLVSYLSDVYPHFDEKHCAPELLCPRFFPEKSDPGKELAIIFTYTQRLVEKFLVQERLNGEPWIQQMGLLQELRSRKQYPSYEKILQRMEKNLKETATRDSDYFYYGYRLAADADRYYDQIERRQMDLNIQLKQNHLDTFYLMEKLKDAIEMQVRSRILKVDYSSRLLEAILREIQDNSVLYEQVPSVYVWYKIFLMVNHPEESYYFTALEFMRRHESSFSVSDLKQLYNYFQNYCIEKINKGEGLFLKEIFHLYRAQLDQGLMIEDGFLSEWHYKNIVTTGIRLGDMDWVKEFIETYKEKLPSEALDNAYRFNLASYYYAIRRFDKVLDLLTRVEYRDLRYSLGAKALLLRTYYDLGEYDALHSLTESFRQYLQRNKLMADFRRQGYYNLFKLTRRAAGLKSNLDFLHPEKARQELRRLKSDMEQAGAIFNKAWLVQKVEELGRQIEK